MNNPFDEVLEEIRVLRKEVLDELRDIKSLIRKGNEIKKYSPQELADKSPISKGTIMNMIRDGRIKYQRIGRKYLITQEEFDRVCSQGAAIMYNRDKKKRR